MYIAFLFFGVKVMVYNATFNNTMYYSYIVAVSFIGGGNRNTQRKAPIGLSQVTDKI